ncbi:MAG: arginyltransferase [Gammaproteobacteria bacterium]|nr:arginyltransferase [Gammaproteobacteria bacterium]
MTRPSKSLSLAFYSTPRYACSYLSGREAVTLFADPSIRKTPSLYATLSAYGFRRSGEHLYRPRCPHCSACIPVRVPVAEFCMSRAQRRTWIRNADVTVSEIAARFEPEHFRLYGRYLRQRHAGGGMDNPTVESYMDFLTSTWSDTRFLELRVHGNLVAVAVMDRLPEALSAVYTFFDPDADARSLGRYAVLCQIARAREADLRWVYLGYWIRDCRKMRYKDEYQPLEYYLDGHWTRQCGH